MEPNFAVAVIWGVTLCAAALSDLRSFRIANVFPAILIMLFVGAHSLSGFSGTLWANLLHFLLALVVGMVLFSRGWVGGGDAKLYAAAALWFNWTDAAALISLTGVAGLLLAFVFMGARITGLRKNLSKEDRRIPYGVAIAAGAIMAANWCGWRAIFPTFNL